MHYDVVVIGGSFAGLSAATYLARARRSVGIIDAGLPRNRFSAHSHGFLTQDGSSPATMLSTARAQVAAYPTTTFTEGTAAGVERTEDGFRTTLATGEVLGSARLILAFGISDDLPSLPGLVERWGRSVLHCPYCHGYEFSERHLGVLYTSLLSVHQALLIAEWGPTALYLNGNAGPDEATLQMLYGRGVLIEPAPVVALHGQGEQLASIELQGGRMTAVDALYVGARTHLNSDVAQYMGCEVDDGPFGQIIRTDGMKMTTVPGVFAAGDITRGAHSVAWASADGVTAGLAAHRSLIF